MSAWIAVVGLVLVAAFALSGCCCSKGNKGEEGHGTAGKDACCSTPKGA